MSLSLQRATVAGFSADWESKQKQQKVGSKQTQGGQKVLSLTIFCWTVIQHFKNIKYALMITLDKSWWGKKKKETWQYTKTPQALQLTDKN